jgi:hypothetical protein
MNATGKALVLLGGLFGPAAAAAAILRLISYDMGIALILLSFAPALFPMIINNHRNKSSQSALSTVTMTTGQFAIGVIFIVMNLMVSFGISIFLGAAWAVLAAQSFLYERKPKVDPCPDSCDESIVIRSPDDVEVDEYG